MQECREGGRAVGILLDVILLTVSITVSFDCIDTAGANCSLVYKNPEGRWSRMVWWLHTVRKVLQAFIFHQLIASVFRLWVHSAGWLPTSSYGVCGGSQKQEEKLTSIQIGFFKTSLFIAHCPECSIQFRPPRSPRYVVFYSEMQCAALKIVI